MTRPARIVLIGLGSLLAALALAVLALVLTLRHPRPAGVAGPRADALAHEVERAVHVDEWSKTGAVRWTFAARGDLREHLWDRARNLARVRMSDAEVLLDVAKTDGVARKDGRAVDGEAGRALVSRAYRAFINDSFWLNPLAKLFDDGVSRSLVTLDGKPALFIHYASGGVTPGDAYLWIPGDDGRPRAWRTWVSVLPIGGLEFTWERWITLATGAAIATEHRALGKPLVELRDVAGASSLAALEPGADPFAPLFTR